MVAVHLRSLTGAAVAAVSAATVLASGPPSAPAARIGAPARLAAAAQPWGPDLPAPAWTTGRQLLSAAADASVLSSLTPAATSIGDAIENLYNTVEPWVRYYDNLVSWAVGWVPFIGILAPQIMFFYDLGEPIVQSLLFNSVDFLDGTIGFGQALNNIGAATSQAINIFINTETSWIHSQLPPYPPIGAAAVDTALPGLGALTEHLGALTDTGAGAISAIGADLGGLLLSLIG